MQRSVKNLTVYETLNPNLLWLIVSIVLVSIFATYVILIANKHILKEKSYTQNFVYTGLSFAIVLSLIFSSVFGLRKLPENFIGDITRYVHWYREELYTFNDLFYSSISWKGDYLFFLIPVITNFILDDPHFYLFLNVFVSIFIYLLAIILISQRLSMSPNDTLTSMVVAVSLPVFFALYSVLLRQGLAFSLCVLAVSFLLKQRTKTSYAILILSFLSHKSVIFLLPVFWISKIRFSHIQILMIPIFSVVLGFTIIAIMQFILDQVGFGFLVTKIEIYSVAESRVGLIKAFAIGALLFLLTAGWNHKSISERHFIKIAVIYFSICMIFWQVPLVLNRLIFFLELLMPIFFILFFRRYVRSLVSSLLLMVFSMVMLNAGYFISSSQHNIFF